MRNLLGILLLTSIPCLAQELLQTDWSGGPGVQGPRDGWYDTYWESEGLDATSVPGQLSILPTWADEVCSGTLVSTLAWIPMGTDWGIEWGDIEWSSYEPEGSDLYFQIRTGNAPEEMGPWTAPITESGTYLGDLLPDDVLLVQYRVTLASDAFEPDSWPLLYDVTVWGWYPGDVEEGSAGFFSAPLLQVLGTPGPGPVRLVATVPSATPAELKVYDLTGRLVAAPVSGTLPSGANENSFSGVPGAYIARLVTDLGSACVQFILME